ncbi:MAG TPA: DUF3365 domain-containing protein [Bacteroidetes bacterium]|nr:DUF3365 domain-containing protein [Bacteroidota bacterium]
MKLTHLFIVAFFTFIYSCENKPQEKQAAPAAGNKEKVYLEKGKKIAQATFAVLGGQLQAALKEGGVSKAVQYCNLAAYPLVDSLSRVHQADIRRTSLKVRNPKNAPTPEEKAILQQYEKTAKEGGPLKPVVKEENDHTIAFYAPIKVNAFCIQCHGVPGQTLKEEDYSVIKKLYPDDKAIGYSDGNLRGMWSIRFKK